MAVNRATCIGAGQCVFADPEAFDQDDDGWVVALREEAVSDAEIASAREAAMVCPSRSIVLEDRPPAE
ncbi:ferredoxin [Rathayibacter sp. VKM Ac-2835]|nr:ferredoxin [Rathayibacter sp. VKM Ac-2835]